jgi:hypothetical protein
MILDLHARARPDTRTNERVRAHALAPAGSFRLASQPSAASSTRAGLCEGWCCCRRPFPFHALRRAGCQPNCPCAQTTVIIRVCINASFPRFRLSTRRSFPAGAACGKHAVCWTTCSLKAWGGGHEGPITPSSYRRESGVFGSLHPRTCGDRRLRGDQS